MKKLAIIALISSSFFSINAFADKVLATYKGGSITLSEMDKIYKGALESQNKKSISELDAQTQKALIQNHVSAMLLNEKVKKSDIINTKEFKEELARQDIESRIARELFAKQIIDKEVTQAKINKAYQEMVKELKGQKEFSSKHILVKDEEEAKRIHAKIKNGEKFEDLAKKHSIDPGSKEKGGSIGYVRRGQLVPEYETKVFSMKKGQVSSPVKSEFGWHIIKLEDMRNVEVPSKKEANDRIKQKLAQEVIGKYLTKLLDDAELKFEL